MEYEDDNAKAIFDSMMKSNKRQREEQTINKIENKYSYWLKWFLGIKRV